MLSNTQPGGAELRSPTYPVLKKIPTENDAFNLSGENAEEAIKNSIERVTAGDQA
ncbi:hypothetical protein ACMZ52_22765 [Klebsiella pneumoniae]|uniref:hypothetical protein n=1 Tax=Klebsiella pneumoniae TaxID=573 RepID=UPI0013151188|nr:hypothetical protein [Klebsiella pneumoniae]HDS9332363.1 hypothetical protein [Klebsiella pneumoniae subsp. pneumoniae]EKW9954796.1 hypothetical protein [Klebsiella pneumoniae]EKZ6653651.1 hypothetical protein [Klebsiella pneumoniae]ELB4950550.1 hypothetical protein [Klebsiella pneumoniae]ELP0878542.1 hypothetical protein [Klebsiella pneumoniae]